MCFSILYIILVVASYSCGFRVTNVTHLGDFSFNTMKSTPLENSTLDTAKKLVIVVGPTASGKTKFGIDLCKKLAEFQVESEIVNADSMQVYKGFSIGTAKPSSSEINSVPHHLLDFVDPTVDYNASLFVKDCSALVETLFSQNKLPLIVGGTNLYIEAILWPSVIDYDQPDDYDSLEDEFRDFDSQTLHDMLSEVDPDRAKDLHKNDRKRIIRSLDVYHVHGITHTELMKLRREERDKSGMRYDAMLILLQCDPEIHRARIRDRIQFMLQNGIFYECRQLLSLKESNPHLDTRKGIFQSIAYKELIPILLDSDGFKDGSPDLLERCSSVLETKTWRYSQRQRTWINNRLLKRGLKTHVVNTDCLDDWDNLVSQTAKMVLDHLSNKDLN